MRRYVRFGSWVVAALAGTLVGGCANLATSGDPYDALPIQLQLQATGVVRDCAAMLRDADRRVDEAGVRDAQTPRVPGYPYLRVDRFTAALGRMPATPDRADAGVAWLELAATLDTQARRAETSNRGEMFDAAELARCRNVLLADTGAVKAAPAPAAAARVPDDYSTTLRALGVYPLTRLAFAAGIRAWHREVQEEFAKPLDQLPARGPRLNYAPALTATSAAPAGWIAPNIARALGAPPLAVDDAWRLLQENAPILSVETASADDRVGALIWREAGAGLSVSVDARSPVAYARLAYALVAGRVHLQLVYTFWFAARPAAGLIDPLAGPLDGLVWRITLDRDHRPLVYDTIHPCGCYHLFFPTDRVRARAQPPPEQGRFDEGLFVPQAAPTLAAGQRLQIFLQARTHYVQRLVVVPDLAADPARRYELISEDLLRALPLPAGGNRSVYGEDGLIAGSERSERFFFWPMGIASAGQMRQWGRHATAFVGRRHFDDPLLTDRYFVLAD